MEVVEILKLIALGLCYLFLIVVLAYLIFNIITNAIYKISIKKGNNAVDRFKKILNDNVNKALDELEKEDKKGQNK